MQAEAQAKVNLALKVDPRGRDGLHPLRSLMLSVAWSDVVALDAAEDDDLEVEGPAPDGEDNLAWRALLAVREAADRWDPVRLRLAKHIPVAAGLAGGSADAAAALVLACAHYGLPAERARELAPVLGSDVPFCLVGGFAVVGGTGERVEPMPLPGDFAVGIVVPPVELATAAVYDAWDRLDGPAGPPIRGARLPPSLRDLAPLANDLWSAAVAVATEVGDWRDELAARWGRPVMLSGSGPALFGFFVDGDEALSALDAVPLGARAVRAAAPYPRGVETGSGTLA